MTPTPAVDMDGLLAKVREASGPDNALDIEVEMALFKPDDEYASVRPNAAGTKLIYTTRLGRQDTFWAWDWTLNEANRQQALSALTKTGESS